MLVLVTFDDTRCLSLRMKYAGKLKLYKVAMRDGQGVLHTRFPLPRLPPPTLRTTAPRPLSLNPGYCS